MTLLAPHLETFFRTYLPHERAFSQHTCESYAYAFQLLLCFVAKQCKIPPSSLTLEQIDAPLVLMFLKYLENNRGNSPTTRNARLAAIKSFAHFIEYRVPSALDQIRRILSIPIKKTDETLVDYLDRQELQALLDAPNPNTRLGLRDRAMLHICFAAGLRVSELTGLRIEDLKTNPRASVHIHGKGRKERVLPLWKETAETLGAWINVRGKSSTPELFLNSRGKALTRSGFEYILSKHVEKSALTNPTISAKRVSPHVLRHTCAMHILKATRDIRKVSLWLGHSSVKSTEVYLRADPTEKLEVLNAGVSPTLRPGHFQAPDKLLEMLRKQRN